MKKWICGFLILNMFSIALGLVGLRVMEPAILFPGSWARDAIPIPKLPKNAVTWKRVLSDAPGDFVEAVFMPSNTEENRGAVVFSHGNAMFIDDWFEPLRTYTDILGYDVLLVEFRGFGRSGGQAKAPLLVDDLRHFVDLMSLHREGKTAKLVFHGWSIGSGLVARLSQYRKPTAIILNSPFLSLRTLVQEKTKVLHHLLQTELNIQQDLQSLDIPILIHHGKDDELIPFAHSEALKAQLDKTTLYINDGGHSDSPRDWQKYWDSISQFLNSRPF